MKDKDRKAFWGWAANWAYNHDETKKGKEYTDLFERFSNIPETSKTRIAGALRRSS